MAIRRVSITNFRSLQQTDIEFPNLCALVGANSSGKSNLLLALNKVLGREWLSASAFDEEDVYAHDSARDISISVEFDPPLSYSKLKGAEPVEITTVQFKWTRYKVGEFKGERRLEQQTLGRDGKPPVVLAKQPRRGEKREYQPLVGVPSEIRESIPLIYIGTNRSLREHLPGARYSMLRQLFDDVDRDLHDPKQTVTVERDGAKQEVSRAERFQQVMAFALKLLRTSDFEALESAIKTNALRMLGFDPKVDADKLDFFFSPFETIDFYRSLDLRVRDGSFSVSATELGEGVQNALVLAILQAFESRRKQGAILLIEEPEMFLHPQMQRSLNRTLVEISKTNQVIYTTHSPHFVSIPEYENVVIVRKGTTGTTVCRSNLKCDPKLREKLRKELDPERSEMFFASRVLLVEGDTEKLALPAYATRIGVDLDRAGASVVEVGGKRNLLDVARIAASFQIPVGIVYDEDSSEFRDRRDEERAFNGALDALSGEASGTRVWRMTKNYEDHVRRAAGEDAYQRACAAYGGFTKAVRGRLLAAERLELPVPDPIPEILTWLAGGDRKSPPDTTTTEES